MTLKYLETMLTKEKASFTQQTANNNSTDTVSRPVYRAVLLDSPPSVPVGIVKKSAVWSKVCNWICVGEEFRPVNIAPEYAVVTT